MKKKKQKTKARAKQCINVKPILWFLGGAVATFVGYKIWGPHKGSPPVVNDDSNKIEPNK